jgi:hypothetical protein
MTEGERLIDTNVLVHAYIRLNEKKQASDRAVVMPIWESGGGITTLQKLCEFFGRCHQESRETHASQRSGERCQSSLGFNKIARTWIAAKRRSYALWSWCARGAYRFGMHSLPPAC